MQKEDIVVKDERIRATLEKDGFLVEPCLNPQQVEELMQVFRDHYERNDKDKVFNSLYSESELRSMVSEKVFKIFEPWLNKNFGNYKYVVGLIFVKNPADANDPEAEVPMHQDPTLLVDEQENKHINLWCPLMDVDEVNGALHVVRGSHLFFPAVQAFTVPAPYDGIANVIHETKECVRMKAGEALLFDNRMLHGSMQNRSGKKRVAVVMALVASDAQYISLFKQPGVANAPIEVFAQKDRWHLDPLWTNTAERPIVGQKIGELRYENFVITGNDFRDLVKTPRPFKNYRYEIAAKES